MKLAKYLLLSAAVFVTSCSHGTKENNSLISLVNELLGDGHDSRHGILELAKDLPKTGDIVIIGDYGECIESSRYFINSDHFDNIDGLNGKDGLPDFSGEVFVPMVDNCSASCKALLKEGMTEQLRERMVRQVLGAIDTTYHLTQFDIEGIGHKDFTKLIVITDPSYLLYGKEDVDALLLQSGCELRVFNPFECAVYDVLSRISGKNVSIGVICDDEDYFGVYTEIFSRMASAAGMVKAECHCHTASGNSIAPFLDSYISERNTSKLDAVIVTSADVNCEKMEEEANTLLSIMNSTSLKYGRYVQDTFSIYGAYKSLSAATFNYLRQNNLFTHRISYPQTEFYSIVDHPSGNGVEIFVVPFNYNVQD